jgi:hypothetical protein
VRAVDIVNEHLAAVAKGASEGCLGPRCILLENEHAKALVDALSEGKNRERQRCEDLAARDEKIAELEKHCRNVHLNIEHFRADRERLVSYAEGLLGRIQQHNRDLAEQCAARKCHFKEYDLRCPECPKDYELEMTDADLAPPSNVIPTDVRAPFVCCGASDPPCADFDGSCKNPANYPPAKPVSDEYTPGCNFPRCVCPDGKECSK